MKPQTLCLVLAVSGLATPAYCSTTIYTSEATFLSAAGSTTWTNTFTGPLGGNGAPFLQYSQSGYSYTITSPRGLAFNGDVVGAAFPTEQLTVSFTSGNIYAVGGNFFVQTGSYIFISGGQLTVTLGDGTTSTFAPSTFGDSYRGFISTTPITSLQFATSGPSSFNGMDNLTVAGAVPEPATVSLFFAGLGAVSLLKCSSKAQPSGSDA